MTDAITAAAFEHAGLLIYPTKVRTSEGVKDYWAVQIPENKGTDRIGGDTLHETREDACASAVREAARHERDLAWRAEVEAREAQEKAEAEARRQRNAGKSLAELRGESVLRRSVSSNGRVMTRREWVEEKLLEGLKPSITRENKIKPMSARQCFRASNEEQRAHERRVIAAGKKDVFWIGGYEVTKTEHDLAVALIEAGHASGVAA